MNTFSEFQVNIFSNKRYYKTTNFLHADDKDSNAKAIAIPQVSSENSRANNPLVHMRFSIIYIYIYYCRLGPRPGTRPGGRDREGRRGQDSGEEDELPNRVSNGTVSLATFDCCHSVIHINERPQV